MITNTKRRGPDRENNVIRGVVIAQAGNFVTGRGAFDLAGLRKIHQLAAAQPKGLRSNFKHVSPDQPDPLGRFLGRFKDPFMSTVAVERDGKQVQLDCVRGDLHIDRTALKPPPGGGTPYGEYCLDLAESDSEAMAASLVLKATKAPQLDPNGRQAMGGDRQPLPPLWRATILAGCDIVSQGDATSSLLGVVELTDDYLLRARWANRKRRAGINDQDETLKAKWRNKKRKAGI